MYHEPPTKCKLKIESDVERVTKQCLAHALLLAPQRHRNPNGVEMSSVSVKRPPKASESKADLVSIEASSGSASGSNGGGRIGSEEMFTWSRRTPTEKLLVGVVAVLVVALVAVIIVAATRKVG